jgi:hypothetical protein
MAKKTKVEEPTPITYELVNLSTLQKWVLMADNTYKVNPVYELMFLQVMGGNVVKRGNYTKISPEREAEYMLDLEYEEVTLAPSKTLRTWKEL